ncbi:MAG: hypothetical protein ACLFMZ_03045 [Spirochaetaceae bacterium]
MIDIPHEFEHLGSRQGFNNALNHFRVVSSLIEEFENKVNIADILSERLAKKEINSKQIVPIVHAILIDKYGYKPHSHTMKIRIEDFSYIREQVPKWKALDITLLYFHPDMGPIIINPKNPEHYSSFHAINENELITIYAGAFSSQRDEKICDTAISTMVKLLDGKKAKTPEALLKGSFTLKTPKKEEGEKKKGGGQKRKSGKTGGKAAGSAPRKSQGPPAAAEVKPQAQKEEGGAGRRMTPFYSVPVTNELFHNGNVEAWKKIIQSYNAKHPDLQVYIYYEGERIHDIASLFKWGKVKHGSAILFAVAGEEIKDVAKLQRYLKQGASHQFEAFLKAPANKILNLF